MAIIKKNNGLTDEIYAFLVEADARYIRAFETKTISFLFDFFTKSCIKILADWIVQSASSRYFSEERFRETQWFLEQDTGDKVIVRKECTYKEIHLTLFKTMKVSQDYIERWVIDVTPDEFLVSSVTSI